MPDSALALLLRQLDTASRLARYHLDSLGNDECLWRPAPNGLHVHQHAAGVWRADWPEHEGYELGPPSIAWLTWHMGFWWSMAIDHAFGQGSLTREQVTWPGSAQSAREWIYTLETQWRSHITPLTAADLQLATRTRWPFRDRPFADVIAWANVELTKNAAEIGYARFLYAARPLTA
jgi:hypothetical protein